MRMFKQDKSSDKDLFAILMDDDDTDPIIVYDEKGACFKFKQVAVLPYEDDLYCILSPITPIKGVAEDEAIAFQVVVAEDHSSALEPVRDRNLALKLFDMYYDLFEYELKKREG